MQNLAFKAHWLNVRDGNMTAARKCRDALTSPTGSWRYAPNDVRVKAALSSWVMRARRAHRIGLGREAVIEKLLVINQGEAAQGPLYAA